MTTVVRVVEGLITGGVPDLADQGFILSAVGDLYTGDFIFGLRDKPGKTAFNYLAQRFIEGVPNSRTGDGELGSIAKCGRTFWSWIARSFLAFAVLPFEVYVALKVAADDVVFTANTLFFISDFLRYGDVKDSMFVCQEQSQIVPCGTLRSPDRWSNDPDRDTDHRLWCRVRLRLA